MNLSRLHWVYMHLLSSPGVVEVYDSMPCYSFFPKNTSCSYNLLQTSDKSFTLKHIEVQHQKGKSNCALFAMAFALTLCMGEDPFSKTYIQSAMREHFMDCCEEIFSSIPNIYTVSKASTGKKTL